MSIKIGNTTVIDNNRHLILDKISTLSIDVTQGAAGTSTIISFTNTVNRSAEVTIQIVQGSTYEIVKALIISSGTDVYIEEYGRIGNPTNVTISGTVAANVVTISITSTTTAASIKGIAFLIDV
jgi:hypothetical protein